MTDQTIAFGIGIFLLFLAAVFGIIAVRWALGGGESGAPGVDEEEVTHKFVKNWERRGERDEQW